VLGTWLYTIQKFIRFGFFTTSGKQIHSKTIIIFSNNNFIIKFDYFNNDYSTIIANLIIRMYLIKFRLQYIFDIRILVLYKIKLMDDLINFP
jgi:hypothetical protein